MYPNVHSTIYNSQDMEKPKCPSDLRKCVIHTRARTGTHTHTEEYYSAVNKNEILPFTATWIDLEIIILSEVSQTKTYVISYHLHVKSKK